MWVAVVRGWRAKFDEYIQRHRDLKTQADIDREVATLRQRKRDVFASVAAAQQEAYKAECELRSPRPASQDSGVVEDRPV